MAISFSGTKLPQTELKEIQKEIYADWGTFRDMDIDIDEGHKSGAEVYESKVTVVQSAYSSDPVADAADTLAVQRTPVTLTKVQYQDTIDNNTLLSTRFQRSMKAGAFNLVSSEFDNAILQDISPAICQDMETKVWDGAKAATKTAIAALSPGAGQGSISAGAQTLVAAMATTLFDSLPAIILYNDSQSKATPGAGLGDYKKVTSISAITSANIAAQYALHYATLNPVVINDTQNPPVWFAPLAHRQLMRIANNSVGAASNQNFLFASDARDAKCWYNGIEVKFKPLVGFMIVAPPKYLKLLMDLVSDMNELETGPMANGAQKHYYKNVQAIATWCTNQRYIVLYGG
jgi:hypothetical protein